MDDNMKRLEKSRYNRMLCGVCGGLGKYLNMDPTVVRILWALLGAASCGTAVLAYLVAAVIMPDEMPDNGGNGKNL